jgi:N-acetylglutamate synthase-like GNAT family acetyltransferase
MNVQLRQASSVDSTAIHTLIAANVAGGHLLPRSFDEIQEHAPRFVVAVDSDQIIGCVELAPLSESVAEVRSLVVAEAHRGKRTGIALVKAVADRARGLGYATLCAFTHRPSHFVQLGFSIVPHVWLPEKIAHDCVSCRQFRRCEQYAVSLPLRAGRTRHFERTAPSRNAALPRASVERLRLPLTPVPCDPEPVPA